MNHNFYNRLLEIVSAKCVQKDAPLSKYTTFRIGGNADYFVTIRSAEQLAETLELCKEYNIPYYMIGKGSNLLVSDAGYRGVILRMETNTNIQRVEETQEVYQRAQKLYGDVSKELAVYRCNAGAGLIPFAMEVSRAGYTGFEYATGIPGSLGGAIVMNAGAYGGEIKDNIVEATIVEQDGKKKVYQKDELKLGYRTSILQTNGGIVTEAVFAFQKGEEESIMSRVKELSEQRKTKQPLEFPSAGSTFKRPEGYFAGKLIMDAGLRGFQVGGAKVSEKHCGFVINAGNATAKDVIELIHEVQRIIQEKFNVKLETEVKFLGEF